jgi:hypothetical protein
MTASNRYLPAIVAPANASGDVEPDGGGPDVLIPAKLADAGAQIVSIGAV